MKTFKVDNNEIKLYDSIDEMPIVNFQKYNKYILIDAGIGSDIDSVDEHLVNLVKLINTDKAKASQELQNLRQNLHMIVSNISPKHMAFAALIYSINGKKQTDLSDDNLKAIMDELKELKHSMIVDFLIWVKKKLDFELETYFPAEFSSAKEKEVYDKIKQRTLLVLNSIEEGVDNDEKIAEIDKWLFNLHKPKSFNGQSSEEVKFDKQFETSCMLISQKTGMNAKSMKVLEFYNTLANINKQVEAELKANKKIKRHNGRR